MIKFLEKIKIKIKNKINSEEIFIIDKSHLHTKHKSFDPKKYHLKLVIKSEQLKKMKKIDAHKKIFSILSEDMDQSIHALEIEIH